MPAFVRALPVAVRTPSSVRRFPTAVGTSPTTIGSPGTVITVGSTMRRNPYSAPLAPMTGYRMPAPTAETRYFDEAGGSLRPELFGVQSERNSMRHDRGSRSKHSGQEQ